MARKKNTVVARMVVKKANQMALIVEVDESATFHKFYRWYQREGRRRKVLLRMSARTDGITTYWRGAFAAPGLDVLAKRFADVTDVTITILKKRKYAAMLSAAPDALGLGTPYGSTAHFRRGIAVRMPVGYLTLQDRMNILTGVKR